MNHISLGVSLMSEHDLEEIAVAAIGEAGRGWERDVRRARFTVCIFSMLAAAGLVAGWLLVDGATSQEAETIRAWVFTLEGALLGGLATALPPWWRCRRIARLLARESAVYGHRAAEPPRA